MSYAMGKVCQMSKNIIKRKNLKLVGEHSISYGFANAPINGLYIWGDGWKMRAISMLLMPLIDQAFVETPLLKCPLLPSSIRYCPNLVEKANAFCKEFETSIKACEIMRKSLVREFYCKLNNDTASLHQREIQNDNANVLLLAKFKGNIMSLSPRLCALNLHPVLRNCFVINHWQEHCQNV